MNAPGVESREGQMTQHRSNISSRREKNAERLATWDVSPLMRKVTGELTFVVACITGRSPRTWCGGRAAAEYPPT